MEGCQPLTTAYSWGGDSSAGMLNYNSGYINNFPQAGGGRGRNKTRKRRKTKRETKSDINITKNQSLNPVHALSTQALLADLPAELQKVCAEICAHPLETTPESN